MGINKGALFSRQNVYIDYPFEDVMYRWNYETEMIYVKFYNKSERSEPISFYNKLFNDALLSGHQITKEEYIKGK